MRLIWYNDEMKWDVFITIWGAICYTADKYPVYTCLHKRASLA
jgi:hypothetical protein